MSMMNDETTTPEKEEVEVDELQQLMKAIRRHGIPAAVGAAIVLAVVLGITQHRRYVENCVEKASTLLLSARTAQEFDNILATYPSTPSAPLALLKLAKTHFDSGNYDMAMGKYEQFKLQFGEHETAPAADLGRLHCLEAKNLFDEALAGFETLSAEHPGHFLLPQTLLGQGRCLEQLGRLEDARILYEEFAADHAGTDWAFRAEEALRTVNKRIAAKAGKNVEQ